MKRKKHAEHENSERWLVSYADLVTLLFALFVILYAESKADIDKLKKVQESMREAFDGISETHSQSHSLTQSPTQPNDSPTGSPNPSIPGGPASPFAQTKEAIQESLKLETGVADVGNKVDLSEDDRGLVVRLAARDFFDDGGVEARADLRPLLDRIAKILTPIPNAIRVEGFTDIEEDTSNSSAHSLSSSDHSNEGWELSTARAAWVVKYWVKRWGMDPARFSAAGLSHFHPLTQRKDDYSRGKNRRVEIIILKAPSKS